MKYKDLRTNWDSNLWVRIWNKQGKCLFDSISIYSKNNNACLFRTHEFDDCEVDYFSPYFDVISHRVGLDVVLITREDKEQGE